MIIDYYSYESSRTHARFEGGGGGEATVGQAWEGEEEEEMTTQHLGWAPCVCTIFYLHTVVPVKNEQSMYRPVTDRLLWSY